MKTCVCIYCNRTYNLYIFIFFLYHNHFGAKVKNIVELREKNEQYFRNKIVLILPRMFILCNFKRFQNLEITQVLTFLSNHLFIIFVIPEL